MAARDAYQPLTDLSRTIIVFLWLDVAASTAYLLTGLGYLGHLRELIAAQGPDVALDPEADLAFAEIAQMLVGLLGIFLGLALVVMIGIWIHRAGWNARHLGAKRMEISPGMAVGWYFVPFANLVYPFRAMREIWLASHDPGGWRVQPVGLLSGWWTLWLLTGFANHIALRATMAADTAQQMFYSELFGLAGSGLAVAGSLVFMRVVSGVQAAQARSLARADAPGDLPPPAPPVVLEA